MKNRSSALAVIAGVLLIGCLLGIAGYHFWGRGLQQRPVLSDAQRNQAHTERLSSRLQLTKDQEEQLKAILAESRQQINAGRMEWESKLRDIRAKTNEKISAILNEEQKEKFRQLLKEAESHGRSGEQGHVHGNH